MQANQRTPQRGIEQIYARQLASCSIGPSEPEREALRRELKRELGVRDPELLDRLLELGIHPETAAAFEAMPLVEVAWADAFVDSEERWRVLAVATSFGLELGRPAHAQLELWLARRPAQALIEGWYALAAERRRGRFDPGASARLLAGIHEVADAAGGILGLGAVSRVERETIDRIRAAIGPLGSHENGRDDLASARA